MNLDQCTSCRSLLKRNEKLAEELEKLKDAVRNLLEDGPYVGEFMAESLRRLVYKPNAEIS